MNIWNAFGWVANFLGRFDDWGSAGEKTLRASRAIGREEVALFGIAAALIHGSRPADEGVQLLGELLPEVPHPTLELVRARLLGMLGRFDTASVLTDEAAARVAEMDPLETVGDESLAQLAEYSGDLEAAVRHEEVAVQKLEQAGQDSFLSTEAPKLARWLCALGRHEEAEPYALLGRELGDERDSVTQALWRQAQALVRAARGELVEAEALAREGLEIADGTDGLNMQGDAYCDLAEILITAGRRHEAAAAFEVALERYDRKKNLAMVAQVRPKLEALRAQVS